MGANHVSDQPVLKGKWTRTLKWKPPEQNTVDFMVKLGATVKNDAQLTESRAAGLYVGYNDVFGEHIDPYVALFPSDKVPKGTYKERLFAETLLPLTDGRLVARSGDPIQNMMIVECAYEDGGWVVQRVRHDKTQVRFLRKSAQKACL